MKVSIAGGEAGQTTALRTLLEQSGVDVCAVQRSEYRDLLICPEPVPELQAVCGTLLLGHGVQAPAGVTARCAVSCGLSDRDTMTLSGCRSDQTALCLQRELVNLRGEVVEQREFIVHAGRADTRLLVLAAAALLCLGMEPGTLAEQLEKLEC